MTQIAVSIGSSVIVLIIGSILSFVVWLLKKSIIEAMDKLDKRIGELEEKINEQREEVLRNYVTKQDFALEHAAHEKIWTEVNSMRERVAKLEK